MTIGLISTLALLTVTSTGAKATLSTQATPAPAAATYSSFQFKNQWSLNLEGELDFFVKDNQTELTEQYYTLGIDWAAFDNLSFNAGMVYAIAEQEEEGIIYETRDIAEFSLGLEYTLWSDARTKVVTGTWLGIPKFYQEEVPSGFPEVVGKFRNHYYLTVSHRVTPIRTTFSGTVAGRYIDSKPARLYGSVGGKTKVVDWFSVKTKIEGRTDVSRGGDTQTLYVTPGLGLNLTKAVSLNFDVALPAARKNAPELYRTMVGLTIDLGAQ